MGQGEDQGCLLTDAGAIYCWGRDNYGQFADGTIGTNVAKPQASLITSGAEKLSVGRYHACAILTLNSELKCWGYNTFGQLGQGNITHSATPLSVTIP
ncbi:MAG: hypothetical protein IPL83_07550 [Bdellovibrionales bacterium]|nr:hypothetical protein [Bdellovibrionales bacterium]